MIGWDAAHKVEIERPTPIGWVRFIIRGMLGFLTIALLMIPLFLLRKVGLWRLGQRVVQLTCRICLAVIGIKVAIKGTPMQHAGVVVANHSSWLDILALNICQRVFFVAKSEVGSWPAIGTMAKTVGTVFIQRKRGDAKRQHDLFLEHAKQGHKLLFFPEGTSTDGRRVLPFKSSLFQAFFAPDLADLMWVQPVTVNYTAPQGKRADFYGWWGEMEMFEHFGQVLSQPRQGQIEVVFHAPLKIKDYADRKSLTQIAHQCVAEGMPNILHNE
jgi:1-acyl-sn-glycerol-3-phosphate acyltransferase